MLTRAAAVALLTCVIAVADELPWAEVADLHGTGDAVFARLEKLDITGCKLVLLVYAHDVYRFDLRDDGGWDVLVYNCAAWSSKDTLAIRGRIDAALTWKGKDKSPVDAVQEAFGDAKGNPPQTIGNPMSVDALSDFYNNTAPFAALAQVTDEAGRTEVTVYLIRS